MTDTRNSAIISASGDRGSKSIPFSAVQTGDRTHEIIIPLAGYKQDDIEVLEHGNVIIVRSSKNSALNSRLGSAFFHIRHPGFVSGAFNMRFMLAPGFVVDDVSFIDGVLTIGLLLTEDEPKRIEIRSDITKPEGQSTKVPDTDAPVPPTDTKVPPTETPVPKTEPEAEKTIFEQIAETLRDGRIPKKPEDFDDFLENMKKRFPAIVIRATDLIPFTEQKDGVKPLTARTTGFFHIHPDEKFPFVR